MSRLLTETKPRKFKPMHLTRKLLFALTLLAAIAGAPPAQSAGQILNISTRVDSQTGDAVVVTEFIAYGLGTETFVLRGLGPSLGALGIPDPLADPVLSLLDAGGNRVDRNDNWMDNRDAQEIEDSGLAPTNALEPAVIHELKPGVYTSVVQGKAHGEGVALADMYDLGGDLQLSAVGTRGFVGTADHVLISGVIISGSVPLRVLVRALGPSLTDAGLRGALADPTVELFNSNGQLILSNDNWKDTQQSEIEATGLAPTDDLESAAVVTLSPGAYTSIVAGVDGGTGLGFLQWYSLGAPRRELNPAPPLRPPR